MFVGEIFRGRYIKFCHVYKEAQKDAKWMVEIDAEIEVINKSYTWELIELPVELKNVGQK